MRCLQRIVDAAGLVLRDHDLLPYLQAAGVDLGHAYQFLDDVADVVAGVAEVGKERGMDGAKLTAVDLFGVDGARRKAREFQDRSLAQLEAFGAKADWLRTLVCEASWKAS